MRISATGDRRPAEGGFTLVELMIVLVIVGIASASVVLAFPDPASELRLEGERFAARVRAAQEQAIVGAADMVVAVEPSGYRFERRIRGGWRRIGEKPFIAGTWPEGARAEVAAEGVRLRFDTTGATEPAEIRIVRDGAVMLVRVNADGSVNAG